MKLRIFISFLCTVLLATTTAFGNEITSSEPDENVGAHPQVAQTHSRMLARLLEMDSTELKSLRETIEKIEAMSPEQKKALRHRINRLDAMDPKRVKAMRDRFEGMPKEEREAMRQRWMDMSPEERREWRQKHREKNSN